MNRSIATILSCLIVSVAAIGCESNAYQPDATPAKLSSYATSTRYPSGMPSTPATDVSFSVAGNGTITLRNASDQAYSTFDLWVNKLYVLQVDHLSARSTKTIAPNLFYTNDGTNLSSVKPETISMLQIAQPGKLLDVAGPVMD
jgi:hypothetical protein